MTVGGLFIRCIGIPICFTLSAWYFNVFMNGDTNTLRDILRIVVWFGAGVAWSIEFYYSWIAYGPTKPITPKQVVTPEDREKMSENRKLWEKMKEMPGGDQDPFETPLGPTKECLTSNQVVVYVKDGVKDPKVVEHISKCSDCNKRIDQLSDLINHDAD